MLSCPVWPSRWILCISMQWLRLKGCHVACDECASGEICSLQHMWVTGSVMWAIAIGASPKFGSNVWALISDFHKLTVHEITGFDCSRFMFPSSTERPSHAHCGGWCKFHFLPPFWMELPLLSTILDDITSSTHHSGHVMAPSYYISFCVS